MPTIPDLQAKMIIQQQSVKNEGKRGLTAADSELQRGLAGLPGFGTYLLSPTRGDYHKEGCNSLT